MTLDRPTRRRLRAALAEAAPWLTDPEVGPTTVDAGRCERCGEHPRVVSTCGPAAAATLCPPCVTTVGADGWCDGHTEVARSAAAWVDALPPWWADAVVLWWIATGEVRTPANDVDLDDRLARLPAAVAETAGRRGGQLGSGAPHARGDGTEPR